MVGLGGGVGCGCSSGKWVRAEGCYDWQLGGGGGENVGAGFRFFGGGLGDLRSWQVLGLFGFENLAGFRICWQV